MPLDPAASRLEVAKHSTVVEAVYAMLRSISAHIRDGTSGALADAIDARPREWVDAVFANTPDALMTAGAQIPAGDMSHITDTTNSNLRTPDRAATAEEHPPGSSAGPSHADEPTPEPTPAPTPRPTPAPTPAAADIMQRGSVAPAPDHAAEPAPTFTPSAPNAPPHGE